MQEIGISLNTSKGLMNQYCKSPCLHNGPIKDTSATLIKCVPISNPCNIHNSYVGYL